MAGRGGAAVGLFQGGPRESSAESRPEGHFTVTINREIVGILQAGQWFLKEKNTLPFREEKVITLKKGKVTASFKNRLGAWKEHLENGCFGILPSLYSFIAENESHLEQLCVDVEYSDILKDLPL